MDGDGGEVLRTTRLTDRTGAYYVAGLGAEAAPHELGGAGRTAAPGRWEGRGSAGLGLVGGVQPEALAAVLSGANPQDGRPLRSRAASVSGFDLTFAAPKSVSTLFALGEAHCAAAVLDAHVEAVGAGIAYTESHAASVRRSLGDARVVVPADGLVAASFVHVLSRSSDPHVHSHVVVANLAHGPDGTWSAMDGRGLVAHARAAGALYDAALRHGLAERMGIGWSRRANGALEVDFVATVVIGAFSSRRAEIRAYAGAHGSPRALRIAWAATRDPKDGAPGDPEELRLAWARRAFDVGLSASDVTRATEAARAHRSPAAVHRAAVHRAAVHRGDSLDERRFAAALIATLHGGVTRRHVVAAWSDALQSGAPGPAVERCVDEIGQWGDGVGVAEQVRPPSLVVPAAHQLRALGPRPSEPCRLRTWLVAAASIERHRARWGASDPRQPLGAGDPAELARMPTAQLAAHLRAARDLDDALVRLGRAPQSIERREIGLPRGHGDSHPGDLRTGIATGPRDWFGR